MAFLFIQLETTAGERLVAVREDSGPPVRLADASSACGLAAAAIRNGVTLGQACAVRCTQQTISDATHVCNGLEGGRRYRRAARMALQKRRHENRTQWVASLELPALERGGEGPETAAVGLFDPQRNPRHLGSCLANEFSATSRARELPLARALEVRQAALGGQLLIGELPADATR
jgi:hypothetical protein